MRAGIERLADRDVYVAGAYEHRFARQHSLGARDRDRQDREPGIDCEGCASFLERQKRQSRGATGA